MPDEFIAHLHAIAIKDYKVFLFEDWNNNDIEDIYEDK